MSDLIYTSFQRETVRTATFLEWQTYFISFVHEYFGNQH